MSRFNLGIQQDLHINRANCVHLIFNQKQKNNNKRQVKEILQEGEDTISCFSLAWKFNI
jgi:hypothetical protein